MKRELSFPVPAHFEATVRRYGLSCAVGLFLADALGGLWHVSSQGAGYELMAPHRSCVVADYAAWAECYEREGSFSIERFHLSVQEGDALVPSGLAAD